MTKCLQSQSDDDLWQMCPKHLEHIVGYCLVEKLEPQQ